MSRSSRSKSSVRIPSARKTQREWLDEVIKSPDKFADILQNLPKDTLKIITDVANKREGVAPERAEPERAEPEFAEPEFAEPEPELLNIFLHANYDNEARDALIATIQDDPTMEIKLIIYQLFYFYEYVTSDEVKKYIDSDDERVKNYIKKVLQGGYKKFKDDINSWYHDSTKFSDNVIEYVPNVPTGIEILLTILNRMRELINVLKEKIEELNTKGEDSKNPFEIITLYTVDQRDILSEENSPRIISKTLILDKENGKIIEDIKNVESDLATLISRDIEGKGVAREKEIKLGVKLDETDPKVPVIGVHNGSRNLFMQKYDIKDAISSSSTTGGRRTKKKQHKLIRRK